MRKDDPLAAGRSPVAASALRDAKVLLLDDGHCFRDQALEICATAHAHESEFRATSLSTLVQMVAGGAGVTLLPALSAPTEAKGGDLVVRPDPVREGLPHDRPGVAQARPTQAALHALAGVIRAAYPA